MHEVLERVEEIADYLESHAAEAEQEGRLPQETAQKLREAGVPEDRETPVVAYCNGGVAATVPLFALHRLGYKNLSNYDGSWNEWGAREDLPAER